MNFFVRQKTVNNCQFPSSIYCQEEETMKRKPVEDINFTGSHSNGRKISTNTFFHKTFPVAASEESFSFVFFIRSFNLILLSHCIINSARPLLKFCRIFFISGSYQKLFIKEVLSL